MSQTNSAIDTMFDVQRATIEQSRDAFEQTIAAQQNFVRTMTEFDSVKQMNDRSYEAAHTMLDVYFDALESMMPSDRTTVLEDVHDTMVEQLDTLETNQSDALDTFEATVQDATDVTDEGLEAFVAALDEQLDTLLELHGDVETQTLESVDEFEGNLERIEAQVEEIQNRIEDASGDIADSTGEMVELQVEATGESIESLPGLGTTYATRLQEQGIETLETLTEANVDVIAEAADVSTEQAEEWIDAAQPDSK